MLRPGEKTKSHRHTSTTLYTCSAAKGATVIGDNRYEWGEGDCFVLPFWRFHRHESLSDQGAILFVMADKPVMDQLGFYREEKLE
jgi:gentisate 1,2-dioxygenase